MNSEKNTNFDPDKEKLSEESNESLEVRPKGAADLERLVVGHEEVQRRLVDPESNPEDLLDSNELKLLRLSPEDELEYRRIRSQLSAKSGGSRLDHDTLKSIQEFADKDKLEKEFRQSCQPLLDEYEKFSIATGTNLSLAEWIKTIDSGGFALGDYNIVLENFIPNTNLAKVSHTKFTFLNKIAKFFTRKPQRSLGDGMNDGVYTREANLLKTFKTKIFEIEYFQHTNNWKYFLEEISDYNDKFIDKLVSI